MIDTEIGAVREGCSMNDVSRILSAIEQGDPMAADELLPLVYEELRKLAADRVGREAPGQTLQATALVHEAYLRLVGQAPNSIGKTPAIFSPPQRKRCVGFWWSVHAASGPASTVANDLAPA